MRKRIPFLVILAFFAGNASAFYNGQAPVAVIGQPNFDDNSANQGNANPSANTVNTPSRMHVQGNRLYLLDNNNNRILIFNLPITSTANVSAVAVIGQANFTASGINGGAGIGNCTSGSLSYLSGSGDGDVDGNGTDLYVSDGGNHRVLIFSNIETKIAAWPGTLIQADRVLGQPDMTSCDRNVNGSDNNLTDRGLDGPSGMRYIASRNALMVADYFNSRVVAWEPLPTIDYAGMNFVIGQSSFNVDGGNSAVSRSTMTGPYAIWSTGTKVVVGEVNPGKRILVYDTWPSSSGVAADHVIGLNSFNVVSSPDFFGEDDARSVSEPWDLDSDGSRLFVGDHDRKRVRIFKSFPTLSTSHAADQVIGKKGYNGAIQAGLLGIKFNKIRGIFYDAGRLYVADTNNHRVLIFEDTFGLYSVSPASSAVKPQRLEFSGDDLPSNLQLKISRSGQSDIDGTSLQFASQTVDGLFQYVSAEFDLSQAVTGGWEIIATTGATPFSLGTSLLVEPFTVTEILPNSGFNRAATVLFIKGTNLPEGAVLQLTKSGQEAITATNVVYESTTIVRGRFNLRNKKLGLWTVRVASGANAATLADAFVLGKFPIKEIVSEVTKEVTASLVDEIITIQSSKHGLTDSSLLIPGGSMATGLTINVSMGAVPDPPDPPEGFVFLKTPLDLAPSGMQFNSDVTLEVPFTDSELAAKGLFNATKLRGKTLNEESGLWEDVSSSVNSATGRISLFTNHFSIYSVVVPAATDLSELKIFPNPFIPGEGHTVVQFTGIPPGSTVEVFTVSGDRVVELNDNNTGAISWNTRNEAGELVVSGLYLALFETPRGRATQKFAIER